GVKAGADVGQAFVVEAAAGVATVDEVFAFECADNQRTQAAPGAARLGEAADDGLLVAARLELEPAIAAHPLAREAVRSFRHHALETQVGDSLEKGAAVLRNVFTGPQD